MTNADNIAILLTSSPDELKTLVDILSSSTANAMKARRAKYVETLPDHEFSFVELRLFVIQYGGRYVSRSQFYVWMRHALVDPNQPTFDTRDLAKLVYLARNLTRFGRLRTASQRLARDLERNPWRYEFTQEDIDVTDRQRTAVA